MLNDWIKRQGLGKDIGDIAIDFSMPHSKMVVGDDGKRNQ